MQSDKFEREKQEEDKPHYYGYVHAAKRKHVGYARVAEGFLRLIRQGSCGRQTSWRL